MKCFIREEGGERGKETQREREDRGEEGARKSPVYPRGTEGRDLGKSRKRAREHKWAGSVF